MTQTGGYELAQVNFSRLAAPLDSAALAPFVEALDEVNAEADAANGFVWRLQTEDGNATDIVAFAWDDVPESSGVIVNLSVWRDVDALAAYVYGDAHRAVLRRRREFFLPMREAAVALWWVPVGHRPGTDEAEERIRRLRVDGPTPQAFTLRTHFPAPATIDATGARAGADDWLCPA